jgi:hypothetical protein
MYRSPWEVEVYVRNRIAQLTHDRQTVAVQAGCHSRPDLLTRAQHRLGLTLIQIGEHLANQRRPATPNPSLPGTARPLRP